MNSFEIEIIKYINTHFSHPVLDEIFKFISFLGNKGWVWIVIALILICIPKTRKSGVCNAIALILCLLITNLCIKPLVDRLRPYEVETALQLIVPRLSDGSFPSGHTCATFASVFVLSKYYKKWTIPLYIFACLMGLSRLYLCVHFPTDVIAGAILGILFGYGAYMITERIWSKRSLK